MWEDMDAAAREKALAALDARLAQLAACGLGLFSGTDARPMRSGGREREFAVVVFSVGHS